MAKIVRRTQELFAPGANPPPSPRILQTQHGAAAGVAVVLTLRLADIRPNPAQPRQTFDEAALRDLAESIRTHGLQNPILVRPEDDGRYLLVGGERRYRAHGLLGLDSIRALPISGDPDEIALVDNVQRVDLDAIELASSLKRLSERHGYTQEKLAAIVGRERSDVGKILSVLRLPADIVAQYRERYREVPRSALIEVAATDEPRLQRRLWQKAIGGATVGELRDTKRLERPAPPPEGRVLKTIATSIRRAEREIDVVAGYADSLEGPHRERLRALQARIARLLGDPGA